MPNQSRIHLKVILAAILVFLIGLTYLFLALRGIDYQQTRLTTPVANLTLLPADLIPTADLNLLTVTTTPTLDPALEGISFFQINSYVQISGTVGNGLHFRAEPGIDSAIVFIANESEVFKVIGGPVKSGQYIWWELIAPYDDNRRGWAVADFMTSVNN
jgi:hypothetical protein